MTNISKVNIDSKDYVVVHGELLKLINKLNKKSAGYLVDELLTESERVMIIKRFGAIFMYKEKYTPYRVSETLGISVPTASRIFSKYCAGEFNNLLSVLTKHDVNSFLSLIEDLIASQASPRARARLMNRVSN